MLYSSPAVYSSLSTNSDDSSLLFPQNSPMASPIPSATEQVTRRSAVIARHLGVCGVRPLSSVSSILEPSACLQIALPELSERVSFDVAEMRRVLEQHNLEDRDWLFRLMEGSALFRSASTATGPDGSRPFVFPDYNQTKEQQREVTMRRIEYLLGHGVFDGWLTREDLEATMRRFALFETIGIYDHSIGIKTGVHFFLWGLSVLLLGTKRHHDKWLKDTENYVVKGCFAMTELGHGSNVRGIETVTTYDSKTGEFIINTPCETAQKYWIGGAANHATHTIVFSQLHINGRNEGVHAFIAQIRDANGNICPNVRIADCGHKIGLNGVDNGRIWFDNLRVPRENMLNSIADVTPDGHYVCSITNLDQRFAAFLSPLTIGRVNIIVNAVAASKVALAVALRYSLTRRAFSLSPGAQEVLLLDYPSHQQRLLPLLAKMCAMSFAANQLKRMYANRNPQTVKSIHIYSSAFKATITWQNMRTLQECRETCGGQGYKTENQVGLLKGEFDVQLTFEGDNNVLMQQVSKALLAEYIAVQKTKKPFKGLGLEHMNGRCPVIPTNLTIAIVRSSQFQMDVFCLRERNLLTKFAAEVAKLQSQGQTKEYAVILSYKLAEELGKAFSEKAILQSILDAETALSPGPVKDILGLLRSLYALISIDEDASFLRYGYLSPINAAVVRQEAQKLIGELRPHTLALVKSFGIPDSYLTPLAFDWIDANSWSKVQQ